MPLKRMALELGMGTDIEGSDYTKAAIRALQNALRQNALVVADAFELPRSAMHCDIIIGAQKPDEVDKEAVAAILPYGTATVRVEHGGMDTPKEDGTTKTTMVNAAVIVYLDLPDTRNWGGAA